VRILSEEEVVLLTGKRRFASQQSALVAMGIPHRARPNGSIVIIDEDLPIISRERDNQLVNLDLGAV